MAYIVMAYIVMAFICMAFIVTAFIVMAYCRINYAARGATTWLLVLQLYAVARNTQQPNLIGKKDIRTWGSAF